MTDRKEQVNVSLVIERFVDANGGGLCKANIQGVWHKCPFLKILHWKDSELDPVPVCSLFPDVDMSKKYGKEWGFRAVNYRTYSPHKDCPLWKEQTEPTENQNGS